MFKIILSRLLGKSGRPGRHRKAASANLRLTKSLQQNVELFREIFSDDEMVVFREFQNNASKLQCALIFVNGMVDVEMLNESMIRPVIESHAPGGADGENLPRILMEQVIDAAEVSTESGVYAAAGKVLSGEAALLIDGWDGVIMADVKSFGTRAITESTTEVSIRGPKEAFTEALIINLTMIRRRIKTHALKFKFKEIGARTKTKICVCYIEGIANEKIVEEVNKRLDDIKIDGVLDSGYIEELIRDSPLSPLDTINHTEKPDSIAGNLLEGRVAVVVDGSPFVLSMPFLFMEYLQVPEDYYVNYAFSSFMRFVRILGFLVATSLPALWLALVTYHQEMLPTTLLLAIFSARQAVPFPKVLETLVLIIIFDVLRESGARMPTPVGTGISFLGAIIIGQAAVDARLLSPVLVVVVAITGITTFLLPKMYPPLALIRLFLVLLAAVLGLYGYAFGIIALLIHVLSMRSFGVPYLKGTGTLKWEDIRDTAIRAPWWLLYYRPQLIGDQNVRRQQPRDRRKSR